MSVHKCPVCEGKGQVPSGFYYLNQSPSVINTSPETCRSCGGKGIIFEYDYFTFNNPNKPYEFGDDYNSSSWIANQGSCTFCAHNDGMVYTSNPVKYKCMIDQQWYEAGHCCENFMSRSLTYITNKQDSINSPQVSFLNVTSSSKGGNTIESVNKCNTTGTIGTSD